MERSTDNRKVEGSNPLRPTIYADSYTLLQNLEKLERAWMCQSEPMLPVINTTVSKISHLPNRANEVCNVCLVGSAVAAAAAVIVALKKALESLIFRQYLQYSMLSNFFMMPL